MARHRNMVWAASRTAAVAALAACGGSGEPGAVVDGLPPPAVFITVDEIPHVMNGSVTYTALDGSERAFRLLLPRSDFTIDVAIAETTEALAPGGLSLACEVVDGPARSPCDGRDLAAFLDADGHWVVPESAAFPAADALRLAARAVDVDGRAGTAELVVSVAARTPTLDPFDDEELWLLTFSRDRHAVSSRVDPDGQGVHVVARRGANGQRDFEEDLRAVGLQGADEAPGAAALRRGPWRGVNAVFRGLFFQAFLHNLEEIFAGVRIRFALEGNPGAPAATEFAAHGGFSIMGFGGDAPEGEDATFGRASIDDYNTRQDDDSQPGLGIFTTSVARFLAESELTRSVVATLAPGVGHPIGTHPADARILAEDFDRAAEQDPEARARAGTIALLLDLAPLALAGLTAHEIGHSLGLVPPGPPPVGFFGGENNASFVETPTDDRHIDTAGFNIMQTAASLRLDPAALLMKPRFEPLSRAYLLRRLLYDRERTPTP